MTSDYYPFGMLMEDTTNWRQDSSYRFGFNGKEMDNSISGQGNVYDYGFRIYNARLGRFLSVDPLKGSYPSLTPFQYASNMPIIAIDLDGLEGVIIIQSVTVSQTFLEKKNTEGIEAAVNYLKKHYTGEKHNKESVEWLRKSTGNSEMSDDVIVTGESPKLSADLTVYTLKYDDAEGYSASFVKNEFQVPDEEPADENSPITDKLDDLSDKADAWVEENIHGSEDYRPSGGRGGNRKATWFEELLHNNTSTIELEKMLEYFDMQTLSAPSVRYKKPSFDQKTSTEENTSNEPIIDELPQTESDGSQVDYPKPDTTRVTVQFDSEKGDSVHTVETKWENGRQKKTVLKKERTNGSTGPTPR